MIVTEEPTLPEARDTLIDRADRYAALLSGQPSPLTPAPR
jgi:hypothetical protein